MATAEEPSGRMTQKQIVLLAAAVSSDNMEAIAEGYMNISPETVKNLRRDASNSEAFNRDVPHHLANKITDPSQARVRSRVVYLLEILLSNSKILSSRTSAQMLTY